MPEANPVVLAQAATSTDPKVQKALLEFLTKQTELVELDTEEKLRLKIQRETAENTQKIAKETVIADTKRQLAKEEAKRKNCIHRKPAPSFESAVAGQRDHSQVAHFICQYCGQEWEGSQLPPNLYIPADRVGGPQL